MSSLADRPPRVVGGKACRLLELQRAGFPVPRFVCSPPDLAEAVRELGLPLAVRSSAAVEDGQEASFAGQFRSYLNLNSLEAVAKAVEQCLQAAREPALQDYRRRKGLSQDEVVLGIIVQEMIQPDLAGVAFTVNPVTGAEQVVIEATLGLSDQLLSGRQSALSPDHPLLRRHAPEIERLALAVQRHFGEPQDIEFAVARNRLHLLQARPITRIGFSSELGEWTNADFRDGGVSSSVCTPLMWSLYHYIWDPTLKGFLREIRLFRKDFTAGKLFFGRPYWNLGAVKDCLAVLPGFVEREFDRDLGVEPSYEGEGRVTPVTFRGLLKTVPTLLAIPRVWKRQAEFDRLFLQGGFARLVRPYENVTPDPAAGLRQLIPHAYFITESNYFRTIFCASLAKLDFMEAFPNADYAGLMSGLPELAHLEPARLLREMARHGETDVTPLLERFPHRSRRELDLRVPRWEEDRAWVETLLRQYAGSAGTDPRPIYREARAAALSGLSARQRRRFNRKLDRLRTFIWLREEMRDLSSRVYLLIRRHMLALARQRGLGDDIFFMTYDEILRDDRSGIVSGRHQYDSYRNFKAPNEIGARFLAATLPLSGALVGVGASHGRVRGTARVARTVEEAAQLPPGVILVCPFTDPGWTPVLDRVAGVVTETGGLLSHAAVICREFGIPAVLGVAGATWRIPDGATVTIHGGSGQVEVG